MANRKYDNPADAKEARRTCNRLAQRRYRRNLKERKRASQLSPSESIARSEMNEEAQTRVAPPDASVQEASSEVESAPDEERRPAPASAPLTPLERVASIEQSIDVLWVSADDPCVRKSLQDSITRVGLKFKDLVGRVNRTDTTPVQQDAPIVPSIQCRPRKQTAAPARARKVTEETLNSLSQQLYKYSTEHRPMTKIERMTAELQRARVQAG